MRTDGHVRFLRLSANVQRKAALVAVGGLSAWLIGTASLLGWQAWTSYQNRDFEERAQAVQLAEARVAAERRSVEQIANSLDNRQDQLETLFKSHFGDQPEDDATEAAAAPPTADAAKVIPASVPALTAAPPKDQVARLRESGLRQEQMVASLTEAASRRTERAELALKSFGIRPTVAKRRVGLSCPGLAARPR